MRISDSLKTVALVIATASVSCSSGKVDYESAILEWTGKEIVFPDSMPLVGGGWYVNEPSDFTIVSYYDSVGCRGCRMRLKYWNEFMDKVDSVRKDKTVKLLVIAASGDETELSYLKKQDAFRYPILNDEFDKINKMNHFPKEDRINTFLLDRNHRVLTLGNPVVVGGAQMLYLKLIGRQENEEDDILESKIYTHDFGIVKAGEKVMHKFHLRNNSSDTLIVNDVLTSCECTEGKISTRRILPYSPFDMDVSFRDTIIGEFYRSVSIIFENKKAETIRFEVSGIIKTNNN